MLLTITYEGPDATDLGFLLHKNPQRPQVFEQSYGKAYVFYPEASPERCTAALLLDINPLDLARGKVGSSDGGLFDYINDRPYVSSSFMSTAIASVFGTAMTGRCDKRQALADTPLKLTATVAMLPCRGDTALLERIFAPLGYAVRFTTSALDEKFPDWGESRYVDLTLEGSVLLKDLLRHLYVLIPVFDRQKHYWVGKEEIEKLLRHGEGWLENHPGKTFIARRYFSNRQGLARLALDRLDDGEGGAVEDPSEDRPPPRPNLNARRMSAVVEALKKAGATSVIDLGCGEGNLLRLLMKEKSFSRIAGVDVSAPVLMRAALRLRTDKLPELQKRRLTLFQSSLTYKDDRFGGYDAATVIEVVEHLDPGRLTAFEQVLFGAAKPPVVVLTTPNFEYNENYQNLGQDRLRHGDHRFEWSRGEFRKWAGRVAEEYGYAVEYGEIGDMDEKCGAPTQMGVFTRCG